MIGAPVGVSNPNSAQECRDPYPGPAQTADGRPAPLNPPARRPTPRRGSGTRFFELRRETAVARPDGPAVGPNLFPLLDDAPPPFPQGPAPGGIPADDVFQDRDDDA